MSYQVSTTNWTTVSPKQLIQKAWGRIGKYSEISIGTEQRPTAYSWPWYRTLWGWKSIEEDEDLVIHFSY